MVEMMKNEMTLFGLGVTPAALEKTFDVIPKDVRKDRLERVLEALNSMKENNPDPNDLLGALLDENKLKALTEYPIVYKCIYQLPFSKRSLYIKMEKGGEIHYGFDDSQWALWTGSVDDVAKIVKSRFGQPNPFYDKLCHNFIERTFKDVHSNGLWYFKNIYG